LQRRCVLSALTWAILAIGSAAAICAAQAAAARSAAVLADRPLLGVSCRSARACMAVGGLFAERWSGLRWSVDGVAVPPLSDPRRDFLGGVSCASPRACMAVGTAYPTLSANADYLYSALAEVWNGSSWSDRSPARRRRASGFFQAVSCTSLSECIAVGQDRTSALAMGWNGRHWRIQPAPVRSTEMSVLNGVSCSSATRCFAVGYVQQNPAAPTRALVERWNGTVWSTVHTPATDPLASAMLNAVSCAGGACVAVGSDEFRPLTERWNGRRWSIQRNPTGAPDATLNGVSCVSPADCTAVGDQTNNTHQSIAERWSSGHWSVERTPTPASGSILWSVSCSSAADCVAAGESAQTALIERSRGTIWTVQSMGEPAL
jgi:hypothetical protein